MSNSQKTFKLIQQLSCVKYPLIFKILIQLLNSKILISSTNLIEGLHIITRIFTQTFASHAYTTQHVFFSIKTQLKLTPHSHTHKPKRLKQRSKGFHKVMTKRFEEESPVGEDKVQPFAGTFQSSAHPTLNI